MSEKGFIVIVTAPSGSGKTTIYKELLKRKKELDFSISFTTRKKRINEVDGIDYYFIDRRAFKRRVARGEFIEWAYVHGEMYGTEKKQIEECLKKGKVCILDVDVQGALKIVKKCPDAVTIFIIPPSLEELAKRLRKRGTENEDKIRIRLMNAKNELEYKKYFKYLVVNDEVFRAVKKIEEIIEKEKNERG